MNSTNIPTVGIPKTGDSDVGNSENRDSEGRDSEGRENPHWDSPRDRESKAGIPKTGIATKTGKFRAPLFTDSLGSLSKTPLLDPVLDLF